MGPIGCPMYACGAAPYGLYAPPGGGCCCCLKLGPPPLPSAAYPPATAACIAGLLPAGAVCRKLHVALPEHPTPHTVSVNAQEHPAAPG